MTIYNFLKLY